MYGGGGGFVTKLHLTLATPWARARQAPLCMGFSRQEYWSGLPFPSPGDLPDPGIEPTSPSLQADALTSEPLRWYKSFVAVCGLTFCFLNGLPRKVLNCDEVQFINFL